MVIDTNFEVGRTAAALKFFYKFMIILCKVLD